MEQHTNKERSTEAVHTEASASHTSPHFPKKPLSAVLKWALILAIIIVVNIFFASVVQVAYPAPEYTDFCEEKQVRIIPDNKEDCEEIDGKWYEETYQQSNVPEPGKELPVLVVDRKGYCDADYVCRSEFEEAKSLYDRNVFVAWIAFGIILILIAVLIPGLGAIMHGFSLGGVLALIIGSAGYWSDMDEYIRVIVLGIALIALIVIGIRKFRE